MIEADSKYVEKKKTLLNIVNKYNSELRENDPDHFEIDKDNLDISKTFCSDKFCRKCGGCCRYNPCVFSPDDFLKLKSVRYMKGILKIGLVV